MTGGRTVVDHRFEAGWQITRAFGVYCQYALLGRSVTTVIPPGTRPRDYDDEGTFGFRRFF